MLRLAKKQKKKKKREKKKLLTYENFILFSSNEKLSSFYSD